MTKNIKEIQNRIEEIKQVVTNLGNIEFTVEDELKFCKEVLKRKEQESEQLKKENENMISCCKNNLLVLDHEELVDNRLTDRVMKAEQALQGIKEIAEDECKNCTVKLLLEDEINCKRCYKTKILEKCEEVEEWNKH